MGTVLYLAMFPITIGSVYEFYITNNINFTVCNILLITSIIGSWIGSKIVLSNKLHISIKFIKYVTAIITAFISLYFFYAASLL